MSLAAQPLWSVINESSDQNLKARYFEYEALLRCNLRWTWSIQVLQMNSHMNLSLVGNEIFNTDRPTYNESFFVIYLGYSFPGLLNY
jgi:hypothetical protein